MNIIKLLIVGTSVGMALAVSVPADPGTNSTTVRTIVYAQGITQRPDSTQPVIDYPTIAGHNLVNLALGRDVGDTNFPNQLLALNFRCDLSAADLVVFDSLVSNVIWTVAVGASNDFYAAELYTTNSLVVIPPNGKTNDFTRFVSLMQVQAGVVNPTNTLLGGFLTIAGRIHRDPVTGCPLPLKLSFDKDKHDKTFADKEISNNHDKDTVRLTERVGLANLMGVIQFVENGTTNNLLLPLGNVSIRYDLPITPKP